MNTNPLTEIGAIVLAVVFAIAGGLLLYLGKIDFTQSTIIFGLAVTVYGGNLALKAPSSAQQTQINTLQQGMQDLIDLLASHTHPAPPTPPSTPTQPVQPAPSPIDPTVSMAAYSTSQMPIVQPGTQT